jgi:hypothetical protein
VCIYVYEMGRDPKFVIVRKHLGALEKVVRRRKIESFRDTLRVVTLALYVARCDSVSGIPTPNTQAA